MNVLFALSALAALAGCAAVAPLAEEERMRIRVVAPAAAPFPPKVAFDIPPGKLQGAATAAGSAAGATLYFCALVPLYCPAFAAIAPAMILGFGAAGAAAAPSNQGLESAVEQVRRDLGAPDVQQLLVRRFAERVTRLTSYSIDSGGMAGAGNTLVAELAIDFVGATLVEPVELFGQDYASRPLRVRMDATMRLVRPSDGATLMTRQYFVGRYGRRIQEYQDDGARLARAIAAAVDELATLMVDDAFLLRSESAGANAFGSTVRALEPAPSGACLAPGYDCWAFLRVPALDTTSPRFRWETFPQPQHLQNAPWLRTARNLVYDLWIFGGDDDRVVEGLQSTEHTLEQPLAPCMRYSWAVRARFDTDAGPRTVDWSTAAPFHKSTFTNPAVRPAFGTPFIVPCSGS
jgi:hypothetical protein